MTGGAIELVAVKALSGSVNCDVPSGVDAYGAAVINFCMIASSVPTTEDVVAQLAGLGAHAER